MRNGRVLQRNAHQVLLGHVATFADGFGNLDCLAEAQTDLARPITGNNQGAETKTASTFDDLGRAVDENDFLGQLSTWPAIQRILWILGGAGTRTT